MLWWNWDNGFSIISVCKSCSINDNNSDFLSIRNYKNNGSVIVSEKLFEEIV